MKAGVFYNMAIKFETAQPIKSSKVTFDSAIPVSKSEVEQPSPVEIFGTAFKQSVISKPAMMLKGIEVYTPGKAVGLDPLLEKASLALQSIQNPEEILKVAKASQGKLWPTGENRKWYQLESKYIPEVLNTWAANVGDQIPLLLTVYAGRKLAKISAKPIGGLAGATAALLTGGPDPSDVATAPAVSKITEKVIEHLGGAAPLIAMEAGSFMDDANLLGIDRDIAEDYARKYGIGSGTIEYAQQLWMLGRYRSLSKPAQKTILKEVLSHAVGSGIEGLEEISQQGLERWLLKKAANDMQARNPDYEIPKIDIWEGAGRTGVIATGVAAVTTMPATTLSISQTKAKQLRESRALRLYEKQQELADTQKRAFQIAEDPEVLLNSPTSGQRAKVHSLTRKLGYSRDQRQDLYNELVGKQWKEFNRGDAQSVVDYLSNQILQQNQYEKITKSGINDKEQKILRGLSRTDENFEKVLDFMSSRNPLPSDPQRREFMMDKYMDMANQIYKRSKKPNKPLISWAKELKPVRYVLNDIEMKTGTDLYSNYKAAVYDSSAGHQAAIDSVNKALDVAGIKRRLATISKKQNDHLMWWLHDPDDDVGKAAWENMEGKTRRIGLALKTLYSDEGKYKIGLLRFRLWVEHEIVPNSIKKQQKKAGKKKGGKPVFSDTIKEQGIKAMGEGKFREWIMGQDWVARENYYPSIRESKDLTDEIVLSLAPPEIRKNWIKDPATIPSAAYTRAGKGVPIEGSVIKNTINHFSRINTALLTMDNVLDFWNNFKKTNPQISDMDFMKNYLNNILGKGNIGGLPIRWAKKAIRTFWRFYFLNPMKGLWFATRNIFQSGAYGATQLGITESAKSFKDIITRKGVLERREDKELMWKDGISERAPVYQEWMMLEESKIRNPLHGYFANIAEEMGQIFIYSDEVNRTLTWLPIHRAAQRNLQEMRSGKISFNQLVSRLKLDTLHPKQQIDLVNLIEEGNDRQFIRDVAEYKTENIHFRYRTGLRSPAEQTIAGRTFVGLMVYPRGVYNLAMENSIKPLYRGITRGNYGMAARGLGNLVALYIGAALARRALYKLTGREAYGLTHTIFGYTPMSPGVSWMQERLNDFSWTIQENGLSAATAEEAANIGGDMAEFLIPFCDIAIDMYEAENDVRGVTFWNLTKKKLKQKYYMRTGKRYRKSRRDDWERISHILFSGGFEEPKEKKYKIWE